MTEAQEIAEDNMVSPHQFSADYGAVQDSELNEYVTEIGMQLGKASHRPHMPYNFRVLNSTLINAYTFAAGSIGFTRSLMLALDNEAAMTAILAHEIGHVCLRHRASSQAQSTLTGLVMAGISAYVAEKHEDYAELAMGLGAISAGALQASYSRTDEREADETGMHYTVCIGQNPNGMVDAMDTLRKMNHSQPDMISRMFSSHPMSEERYQTAIERANTKYSDALSCDMNRERFMDKTASLRRIEPAINQLQSGSSCMMQKSFTQAYQHYQTAIKQAPNDYTALLLMANCCNVLEKPKEAFRNGYMAMKVYPGEPQSRMFLGLICEQNNLYEKGLNYLQEYRSMLPGNPIPDFHCGFCLEQMGRKQDAAQEYIKFLQQQTQGVEAQHAYQTLINWKVIAPPQQQQGT